MLQGIVGRLTPDPHGGRGTIPGAALPSAQPGRRRAGPPIDLLALGGWDGVLVVVRARESPRKMAKEESRSQLGNCMSEICSRVRISPSVDTYSANGARTCYISQASYTRTVRREYLRLDSDRRFIRPVQPGPRSRFLGLWPGSGCGETGGTNCWCRLGRSSLHRIRRASVAGLPRFQLRRAVTSIYEVSRESS